MYHYVILCYIMFCILYITYIDTVWLIYSWFPGKPVAEVSIAERTTPAEESRAPVTPMSYTPRIPLLCFLFLFPALFRLFSCPLSFFSLFLFLLCPHSRPVPLLLILEPTTRARLAATAKTSSTARSGVHNRLSPHFVTCCACQQKRTRLNPILALPILSLPLAPKAPYISLPSQRYSYLSLPFCWCYSSHAGKCSAIIV